MNIIIMYGYEKTISSLQAGRLSKQLEKRMCFPDVYRIVPFWKFAPEMIFNNKYYPTEEVKGTRKEYFLRSETDPITKTYSGYKINKLLYDFCKYVSENFNSLEECETYYENEKRNEKEMAEKQAIEESKIKMMEENFKQWENNIYKKAIETTDEKLISLGKIAWEKYIDGEFTKRFLSIKFEIDALNGENVVYGKRALKERLCNYNKASKYLFYLLTGIKLPTTNKGTFEIIDNWEEYKNGKNN